MIDQKEINYQVLFETAHDAIFLMKDYIFVDCNYKALEMFGCERSDLIGKLPVDFSPALQPDGSESEVKAKVKIDTAFAGESQVFEWRHARKDGTLFDVEVCLNPIKVNGIQYLQALVRDISERKKSEDQLRQFSECMLSFTADPHVNINLLTKLCGEILGATFSLYNRLQRGLLCIQGSWQLPEEIPLESDPEGKLCYDVIKSDGKEVFELKNLPETKYFTSGSLYEKYHLESYIGNVVRCEGKSVGSLCAVFQHDYQPDTQDKYFISLIASAIGVEEERKLAHERLVKNATELEELNQSKDKFFSIISHDLKGPFNSILGFTDILATDWNSYTDEERRHFIANIHSSAQNTYKLLENLLEWAMTQAGTLSFNPVPFDLSLVTNEVVKLLREQAEVKQIKLFSAINFNTMVLADENMVKSVLRNLISNAIKYTMRGGQVNIFNKDPGSTPGQSDMIQVCVRDTGVGMEPETVPKLFRIDEKVRTSGTAKEKGTGLGLILCKEAIEKHGGKIWVESEPGKGSLFCFTLPASSRY